MGQEVTKEKVVAVVAAGLHDPSGTSAFAGLIAAAVRRRAPQNLSVTCIDIDVRGLAMDLARRTAGLEPSSDLDRALTLVQQTDGLIAVTATAQGSYSGLFKLFFDQFEPGALTEMPTVIAATGGSPRYTLMLDHAMRPLFGHLRADVMPTALFAIPADIVDTSSSPVAGRIERAADQLLARLVSPARQVQGEWV